MKKALIILVSSVLILACNSGGDKNASQQPDPVLNDTANFTTIEWIDSTFQHLGKITEGEELYITYKFKNSGTHPLIIRNVTVGCGCTIPETPKEPFAPGAEGEIKAKFNSKGRVGNNHKQVYVIANTKPDKTTQLDFSVEVIAASEK